MKDEACCAVHVPQSAQRSCTHCISSPGSCAHASLAVGLQAGWLPIVPQLFCTALMPTLLSSSFLVFARAFATLAHRRACSLPSRTSSPAVALELWAHARVCVRVLGAQACLQSTFLHLLSSCVTAGGAPCDGSDLMREALRLRPTVPAAEAMVGACVDARRGWGHVLMQGTVRGMCHRKALFGACVIARHCKGMC